MAIPTDVDQTWNDSGSVSLNAGELRRADAALFAGIGSALGVGGGITRHGDTSLAVTVDGSDVVTIQPGAVVVPGNAVAGTGVYRFGLSAAITGSLTARNATNPRITLVVARAMDDDVVGTHDAYTGRFSFIDGTPAASPSVPALPSMAVELGRITVPNTGGGAASVDLTHRTFATAIGGDLIVPTSSMLPASAPTYQRATALDTGVRYYFNGTTWVADFIDWTDLSLGSGFAHAVARTQYSRAGREVTVAVNATKTTISAGDTVATVPTGFRPTRTIYFVGAVSGTFINMSVDSAGLVKCNTAASAGVNGTISYPVPLT